MKQLLIALILVLCVSSAICDEDNGAAECYLAGEKAWAAGDLDTAIAKWTVALNLKPSSVQTKDMLIKAYKKKVQVLNEQIEELRKAEAQAKLSAPKPEPTIVIKSSVVEPEKLLPPDKYTPEALDATFSGKYTTAQKEAYWNSIRGWKVKWPCRVVDVKQKEVGLYELSLNTIGNAKLTVITTCKVSDQQATQLRVGGQVTVCGELDRRENSKYYLTNSVIAW